MTGVVTAGDCTVEVVITDGGRERVRRVYNAPRLNEIDLLTRAVEEGGADPLAVEALDMARRLLGVAPKAAASFGEDSGASVGEPWSKGASYSHRRSER